MNEDYLKHYGVKGMRWGVRRASRSATSSAKSANRQRLSDVKTSNKKKLAAAKTQDRVAKDKVKVGRDISKYGSKEKAVSGLTKRASRNASVRKVGKTIGLSAGSAALALHAVNTFANYSVATALAMPSVFAGASAVSSIPAAPLTIPAMAVSGLMVAGAARTKKRTTKRERTRIENVKRYG